MVFVGTAGAGHAQPFECLLDAYTEIAVGLHNRRYRRNDRIVRLLDHQAFNLEVSAKLIEIAATGIAEHHRLSGLIDALAQDQFAVCVFLQQFDDRFRLQRQRACNGFTLFFRVKGNQRGLAIGQQRLVVEGIHHRGGG
ncbi:hypothetical protein D3C78_1322020 [compost metagenome]